MTEQPRHTADTITDPALDALYERAEEAEAALDRIRALAGLLDRFAENAFKADDRQLYTAIAADIRDRAATAATKATDRR